MKLVNKISRSYLINSSLLLVAAFIALYLAINWILTEELDEELLADHRETISRFERGVQVSNPPFVEVDRVSEILSNEILISDTSLYITDEEETELEPFRQAVSYFGYNGKGYRLVIRKSLIEQEDLIMSLFITFLVLVVSLSVIMNLLNRRNTEAIFKPFYANLDALKNYSIKSGEELSLQDSNIDEFIQLNEVLKELSGKVGYEYKLLKEFSEDLSHELQTPVAVIKNKLELLMQKESDDEEAIDSIQKSYQNINKLDKLNRSLILLSRLENKDLFDSTELDPKVIIERTVSNFSEAAELKTIDISCDIKEGESVKCNETLFDILLSNLISNAIRHNYRGGIVRIDYRNSKLQINNTSRNPAINRDDVFARFNKQSKSAGSVGLGLAIVKKICDKYDYGIHYSYLNSEHCFIVHIRN